MKIDLLSDNTLKLILTKNDERKIGINFKNFAPSSPSPYSTLKSSNDENVEIRKLLSFISDEIKKEFKLKFPFFGKHNTTASKARRILSSRYGNGKIVIEAFPLPSENQSSSFDSLLYISRIPKKDLSVKKFSNLYEEDFSQNMYDFSASKRWNNKSFAPSFIVLELTNPKNVSNIEQSVRNICNTMKIDVYKYFKNIDDICVRIIFSNIKSCDFDPVYRVVSEYGNVLKENQNYERFFTEEYFTPSSVF